MQDLHSLSGWSYSAEAMVTPSHPLRESLGIASSSSSSFSTSAETVRADMQAANADIVCCTHTCLAFLRVFSGGGVVVNNGSAGMGNFAGSAHGCITRVAPAGMEVPKELESLVVHETVHKGARVSALEVRFDGEEWEREFLKQWGEGTAAHESYFERIKHGVPFWDRADSNIK